MRALLAATAILVSISVRAQSTVYVVDSIRAKDQVTLSTEMSTDDIADFTIIRNSDSLEALGITGAKMAVFIFTKRYRARTDEEKAIPTSDLMQQTGDQAYWRGTPYTGKFIDYYFNGEKKREGALTNGRLSGVFTMYYRNGNVSTKREYKDGVPDGLEKQFYPDGNTQQQGDFSEGKEQGIWETFYPNGQVQQHVSFINGEMEGASLLYYSNGKLKSREEFSQGKGTPDPSQKKLEKLYSDGDEAAKKNDDRKALERFNQCIEEDSTYPDAWFGKAAVEYKNQNFDDALTDFNRALAIEPYFKEALTGRAQTRIHKYNKELPREEKTKVCADLYNAALLGDDSDETLTALKTYCGGITW